MHPLHRHAPPWFTLKKIDNPRPACLRQKGADDLAGLSANADLVHAHDREWVPVRRVYDQVEVSRARERIGHRDGHRLWTVTGLGHGAWLGSGPNLTPGARACNAAAYP